MAIGESTKEAFRGRAAVADARLPDVARAGDCRKGLAAEETSAIMLGNGLMEIAND